MAEPAQRLGSVYDSEKPEPLADGELKSLEQSSVTPAELPGRIPTKGEDQAEKLDSQQLSRDEESEQSFYKKSGSKNKGFMRGPFNSRKKRAVIASGVLVAMIAAVLALFFSLLPLKLLHIVNNLQDHFFASPNAAVTQEVDNMAGGYVKKYVMPGLKKCGTSTVKSTIDKTCSPIDIAGTSPVSNLYKAWRTTRFENVLAEKYGTEFKYNSKSGRYFVKTPFLSKDVDVTDFANGNAANLSDSVGWKEVSGKEFSQFNSSFHKNIDDVTKYQRLLYKFKMNGILNKYGSTRCVIACDTRLALSDSYANKKRAAKIKIAQRVIEPQSEQLGLIIQCVIAGLGECDVTPGSGEPGLNGEPRSKAEVVLQNKLVELAAQEGTQATLDAVSDAVKDINEKGWTRYAMGKLFAQAVGQLGGDEAAQQSARSLGEGIVGPVGWGILAAQIIDGLNKAGPLVKELGYDMNSATYAKTFLTYRTYADETRNPTAPKDATMIGSFINSIGPGLQDDFNSGEKQLGGTAEAEQTPLYQTVVAGQSKVGSNSYICENGKPVPVGQLVCAEEKIGNGNKYLDNLHNFLNLPGLNVLTNLAGIINGTVSKILLTVIGPFANALTFALEHTPGVSDAWNQLVKYSTGLLTPLFESLVNRLINVPVTSNISGGRSLDAIGAGADVVGNDFSHHQLGGVVLTAQQTAELLNSQSQDKLRQYNNQSFIARIFDKNSSYSAVSRLSLAMPSSGQNAIRNISAIFTKPLGGLAAAFGSVFMRSPVYAATAQADPFGITQYGYPADDPIFSADAEAYWDEHCTDSHMTDAWNKASLSHINDDTLQPENPQQAVPGLADGDPKGTNPCLLIQATVGSAGALFDSSLLTADDVTNSSGSVDSGQNSPSSTAGSTLDLSTIFNESASVACAPGTKDLGVQNGYHDGQIVKIRICAVSNIPSSSQESNGGFGVIGANGKLVVNSRVSGAVYSMAKAAIASGTPLGATSGFRTMSHQQSLCPCDGVTVAVPGYSNHQMGLAIDFAGLPSSPGPIAGNPIWEWLANNALSYGYKNYPREAWHWSPTGN